MGGRGGGSDLRHRRRRCGGCRPSHMQQLLPLLCSRGDCVIVENKADGWGRGDGRGSKQVRELEGGQAATAPINPCCCHMWSDAVSGLRWSTAPLSSSPCTHR